MSPVSPSTNNDPTNNAIETIWNPDIEQSFLEALAIYPPCGRRKIILTADGKVYGRNELVARYIKIRTGKIRTRKQVSSHLQVLTKRLSKELQLLREDKQAQAMILERLRQSTPTELRTQMNDDKIIYPTESEFSSTSNSESEMSISSVQNLLTASMNANDPFHIEHCEINTRKSPINYLQEKTSILMGPKMHNYPSPSSFTTSPRSSSYGLDQSRCSSSHSTFSISLPTTPAYSCLLRRPSVIGDDNFHLLELGAFIEWKQTSQSSMVHSYSEISSMYQHDIIRFNANDSQMKEMQNFETILIDQVSDKFYELKSLFNIYSHRPFFLIKFWADVPLPTVNSIGNPDQSFFTSYSFSSCLYRPIHVSTRVSSFGKQVLEKVEVAESPQRDLLDSFTYRFDRSPLSSYMVQFIQKLRSLPSASLMNDVLENFTMLQVIKSYDGAQELLLCLAFVFEVAMLNVGGPQYQVYKLLAN